MDLVKAEIAPKLLVWTSVLTEENKKVSTLLKASGTTSFENDTGLERRKEV